MNHPADPMLLDLLEQGTLWLKWIFAVLCGIFGLLGVLVVMGCRPPVERGVPDYEGALDCSHWVPEEEGEPTPWDEDGEAWKRGTHN